jgi:hypothetical protein
LLASDEWGSLIVPELRRDGAGGYAVPGSLRESACKWQAELAGRPLSRRIERDANVIA